MPLLAKGDVTVHKLLPGATQDDPSPAYESVVLVYGETLDESQVPKHVLEGVEKGESGPLVKVTHKEAERVSGEANRARAEAESGNQVVNASNAEEQANDSA